MIQTIIFWFATFLSILGAWWVGTETTQNRGFMAWMVSNPILSYASYTTGASWGAVMFVIFFVFAVRGYMNSRRI